MSRAFWVWLHRWAGLTMAGFLVIEGLTGSVLAFREELDVWLNPELLTVVTRTTPMLDPITLRERAQALYPGARIDPDARIDVLHLHLAPGRSVEFAGPPYEGAGDGSGYFMFYLDPYTGQKIGERTWGEVSLARKDIISFLYRLHMTLSLPTSTGNWGRYILGVIALVWTIDCFVSFYLTFPLWRRVESASASPKSWWSRWRAAWLIKINAGTYRINFDIHRAFGLWTWAMLFVFAWSSVAFNLNEVYGPVMNALFGPFQQAEAPMVETPSRKSQLMHSKLGWREARDVGIALLQAHANVHGYKIREHEALYIDQDQGVYMLKAHSSLDRGAASETIISFDAETGEMRSIRWPGEPANAAGAISLWLAMLHMAAIFGLPMKIFVCAMGFVITALSVTGVYIWWKKRKARKRRAAQAIIALAREAAPS